jgi:hypothetical protein
MGLFNVVANALRMGANPMEALINSEYFQTMGITDMLNRVVKEKLSVEASAALTRIEVYNYFKEMVIDAAHSVGFPDPFVLGADNLSIFHSYRPNASALPDADASHPENDAAIRITQIIYDPEIDDENISVHFADGDIKKIPRECISLFFPNYVSLIQPIDAVYKLPFDTIPSPEQFYIDSALSKQFFSKKFSILPEHYNFSYQQYNATTKMPEDIAANPASFTFNKFLLNEFVDGIKRNKEFLYLLISRKHEDKTADLVDTDTLEANFVIVKRNSPNCFDIPAFVAELTPGIAQHLTESLKKIMNLNQHGYPSPFIPADPIFQLFADAEEDGRETFAIDKKHVSTLGDAFFRIFDLSATDTREK